MSHKRILAIIKPFQLDSAVESLGAFALGDIEVSEVRGYGRQKGHLELYAGSEYELSFLPKVRLEFLVEADQVGAAAEALRRAVWTGRIGDGKIFVLPGTEAEEGTA